MGRSPRKRRSHPKTEVQIYRGHESEHTGGGEDVPLIPTGTHFVLVERGIGEAGDAFFVRWWRQTGNQQSLGDLSTDSVIEVKAICSVASFSNIVQLHSFVVDIT